MTTTWLAKAMPEAIQKQVDGNFISDWQGKKIDREKQQHNKLEEHPEQKSLEDFLTHLKT